MIKINLLAEKKPVKPKAGSALKVEGLGTGGNVILVGILLAGLLVAGGWWWVLESEASSWRTKVEEARQELKRLEEPIRKSKEYEQQKVLLAQKIDLITVLKKKQEVPVHILDQVSRNLPDFLWLDSMSANNNQISISGKATTYTAVSNFYTNLTGSGYFQDVQLGRVFEVPEGVAFSLTCNFVGQPGSSSQPPQS